MTEKNYEKTLLSSVRQLRASSSKKNLVPKLRPKVLWPFSRLMLNSKLSWPSNLVGRLG